MVDSLVQQHIRAVVAFEEDYAKRKEALLADHEAKGDRIISGGQTYGQEWEITDYRTGEVIAAGDGGLEGYAEVVHDHGRTWVHIDPITEHLMDAPDPLTPGLPETLCEQLAEWVRDRATDKDINTVLAWGSAPAQEPEAITRARRVAQKLRANERANDIAQQRRGIQALIQETGVLTKKRHTVRVHITDEDLAFVTVLGHKTRQHADQVGLGLVVALEEYGVRAEVVPAQYGAELSPEEATELHPVTVLLSPEEAPPAR